MIKAQVFNLVFRSVNLGIAVLEVRFDDKGGWVAVFAGGGVVGAGVAAFSEDERDVAVLLLRAYVLVEEGSVRGKEDINGEKKGQSAYRGDERFDKLGQASIDKVGDDSDTFRLTGFERLGDVSGHILLEHGFDDSCLATVFGKDGLAA